MNKILATALFLVTIISVNCSDSSERSTEVLIADKELDIKVEGMVCAVGCAKYIEKEVAKLNGVTNCNVNFDEGTAVIEYSSKETSDKDLVDFINAMNDGQYGASVTDLQNIKSNSSSTPDSRKSKDNESAEVSFHFPELVTYFVGRVIR